MRFLRPTAGLSLVFLFVLAAFAQGARIVINGRPAAHAPIVQNGETCVSVSDLKADDGDGQSIRFRNLLPGASVSRSLTFWFPSGTSKADVKKAVRRVLSVDVKTGLLRDSGLRCNGASPAFRVTL